MTGATTAVLAGAGSAAFAALAALAGPASAGCGAGAIFFAGAAGFGAAEAVFAAVLAVGAGMGFSPGFFDKGTFVSVIFFAAGLAEAGAAFFSGVLAPWGGAASGGGALAVTAFFAGAAFLLAALVFGRLLLTADVLTVAPRDGGTASDYEARREDAPF